MKYKLIKNLDFTKLNDIQNFSYNEEFDDISSISSDVALFLNRSKILFNLQLDNLEIPVEAWGDFQYFMDGFKDYVKFLFKNENSFQYELYGQGIETIIYFFSIKDEVTIKEDKFLKRSYLIKKKELQQDAIIFFDYFNYLLGDTLPNLRFNSFFLSWEKDVRNIIFEIEEVDKISEIPIKGIFGQSK